MTKRYIVKMLSGCMRHRGCTHSRTGCCAAILFYLSGRRRKPPCAGTDGAFEVTGTSQRELPAKAGLAYAKQKGKEKGKVEEKKKQAPNNGAKRASRAKWVLVLSLCLCLVSMMVSSAVQSSFGNVEVKELKLVDSSGYAVSTLLYKPNSASAENKAPCIITIEGWYNNKEMQDLYSVEYARRGYVVLAVDMHGHGDTDSTDAQDLYSSAVGVDAAVQLAGSLPYVDTGRIGITGHSSGGAASDMAVAIDNERAQPLISAVLFQASTWVDDLGQDHSADFGTRSVGIIADLYDEFFFWTEDAQGNTVPPKDFLGTDDAKNFVNFNNGAQDIAQDVQPGQYYEDGDAFRVIYQPACTHPWVHFSAQSVGYGIEFFEKALGAPNPIAATSQVWQWKTAFNFLGLVGIVMFLLSFVTVALDVPYFSVLRAQEEVQPAQVKGGAGKAWFWVSLAACAVFSMLSYMWAIQNVYSKTTAFFVQTGPLTMGVWCVLSGVFALIVLAAYYFFYGKKNGFSPAERGVTISGKKLWRTLVLAVLACGLAFLILFFADFFFKTDFRLWVLTMKAFEADKVLIGLRYLPLFLFFYVVNSVAVNCFNYNTIGGRKGNVVILGMFNALGAIAFVVAQYGGVVSSGMLRWYSTEGWRISGIWLYPAIVYLFVTPFMTRYIYKKTRNPYLCGIINAIIITMLCVANTTTVLGGGAVVAANY